VSSGESAKQVGLGQANLKKRNVPLGHVTKRKALLTFWTMPIGFLNAPAAINLVRDVEKPLLDQIFHEFTQVYVKK
jgi:hypothetical protein